MEGQLDSFFRIFDLGSLFQMSSEKALFDIQVVTSKKCKHKLDS